MTLAECRTPAVGFHGGGETLAARGDERAAQLSTRLIGEWQHLARVSPDIVEIDIVLAEMLARAATDPHHREADPMEGAA